MDDGDAGMTQLEMLFDGIVKLASTAAALVLPSKERRQLGKKRKGDNNIRLHDEDSTPRRVCHSARSSGCHVEQL